jgi:uncharacterized protein (TIGR03435 family)
MTLRVATLAICSAAAILAQAPFESAVIRESLDPDAPAGYSTANGKLTLQNQTLADCARMAYGARVARAPAAPKWVETQRFDIEVEAGRGANELELSAMLRGLLENRFKLGVRRESRTIPGYALAVAKGDFKLEAVEPGPGRISSRPGSIRGEAVTMAQFAQTLEVVTGRPVVDKTGLAGVFSFTLAWVPDVVQPGALTADDEQDPNVLPDMPKAPGLLLALQEQLGLKLESRKLARDVVLIERAQRP